MGILIETEKTHLLDNNKRPLELLNDIDLNIGKVVENKMEPYVDDGFWKRIIFLF